ncbi:MocR-like pyridoxine biosynthesis transcription factor PdxR [Craterilacuibacter sinensis]|uniref:Putative 8-amino-7-oxononanoate synthase n=1 Tax=Craterilacuibacter sinensis TaxID=2686017 RepID=A0A845BF73_9NEIS|nr:PLP-dependent aminotransferase family protein [Craterilacuibacter sinensis]MXR35407.1 aminotransferase class I/II-fold pyridoxal phosphate-dependent enzyme [Craterilacuibacter sinensis]
MPTGRTTLSADWISEALAAIPAPRPRLDVLLRNWIASGRLSSGSRLPASRTLASSLGIARNTVVAAYEQLVAEGYLESRQGSGTYVASLVFSSAPAIALQPGAGLSARGTQLVADSRLPVGLIGAFAPGVPEIRRFPHASWQALQNRYQRLASPEMLHYRNDGGYRPLREALADYLNLARGVRCDADQIIVTQGAQSALELSARLLCDPGDYAWMEEPGYSGAQSALQAAGLSLLPVPVDEAGLVPERAPAGAIPKLIYLTPSHQYPQGAVMPLTRRLELLARAKRMGSWIVEDDYDSEFRYSSAPIPALQGMAEHEHVIYVGTFSKVMYPGLRLGYMVVPGALVDAFRCANARLYREGHYPLQAALAEFIGSGQFARHIRRMRELYAHRQLLLRSILQHTLGDALPLSRGEAGMHLVASLPDGFDELALSSTAASEGLWLRPLARHYLAAPTASGLVLGYAGVEDSALQQGALRLSQLLEQRL